MAHVGLASSLSNSVHLAPRYEALQPEYNLASPIAAMMEAVLGKASSGSPTFKIPL